MNISERPTDMLERQLKANHHAARRRNHFAHLPLFRAAFVRDILAMRAELRTRREDWKKHLLPIARMVMAKELGYLPFAIVEAQGYRVGDLHPSCKEN